MPAAKESSKPVRCLTPQSANKNNQMHRHRHRVLCSREYKRLHAMVPAIAAKSKVSKITVIEETIKYIDELHTALWLRLQTKGLPRALKGNDCQHLSRVPTFASIQLGTSPGLLSTQDVQHVSRTQLCELLQNSMPSNKQSNSTQPTSPTTPVCQRTSKLDFFPSKKLKKKKNH